MICQICEEEFSPRDEYNTICLNCEERLMYEQEQEQWIEITREMALDAGDPSLEGQLWKWK